MIEHNLLSIFKVMTQNRGKWNTVTDKHKEDNFFIFNRYFSKKYPHLSQLLNNKTIDKVVGMDLWFHFIGTEPYPEWFWSKVESKKDKGIFSEKDIYLLLNRLDVKEDELDFLICHFQDDLKDELKYIKNTLK